jgi:phosphoribosyl-AMP cyclohydrolase
MMAYEQASLERTIAARPVSEQVKAEFWTKGETSGNGSC